jgi:UDP-2,4-diacetamido-2,4,6-trideoxy-beta-L-altropyranose hydrolase
MRNLLIRADASPHIGTGHVMRCLALAQAWQLRGGDAVFVTHCSSNGLRRRLSDEGFKIVALKRPYPDPGDWKASSNVLAAHPGAWVVLDGYHLDSAYQRLVKEAGHPVLVIDDMAHLDYYYGDLLLNQNIHAEQLKYSCGPHTRLLLGTRYVLLRREFWPWDGWQRKISQVANRVLVTLGGADRDNQTLKVIQALRQVEVSDLEATVVVGVDNPHLGELEATTRYSPFEIRFLHNASNMPALMAGVDVAVSSGGTTCWELAFMGLPFLTMVIAPNQKEIAESLAKTGIALNCGWFSSCSPEDLAENLTAMIKDSGLRKCFSQRGKKLVDGQGSARILDLME